jgi:hypothetical protein
MAQGRRLREITPMRPRDPNQLAKSIPTFGAAQISRKALGH